MRPPKKILLIKTRGLSDTLLLINAIDEIRASIPQAQIDVIVSPEYAPIFEQYPGVRLTFSFDRRVDRSIRARSIARLGIKLFKEKYDVCVCLHASPSASLLTMATRAKTRVVHYHQSKVSDRVSTVKVDSEGLQSLSLVEFDLAALRAAGLIFDDKKAAPKTVRNLNFELTEAEKLWGKKRWEGIFKKPSSEKLVLDMGYSRVTQNWGNPSYAQFAIKWAQERNAPVVAVFLKGELENEMAFIQKVDQLLSQTVGDLGERARIRALIWVERELEFRYLAALLKFADLFIGNNRGLNLMALAVGTRTITFFGPDHWSEWWGKLNGVDLLPHQVFCIENLDCRMGGGYRGGGRCEIPTCDLQSPNKHKCLSSIGVDEAYLKVTSNQLLAGQK